MKAAPSAAWPVPEAWHQRMQVSPLVLLEAPLAQRIAHIRAEYVDGPLQSTEPCRLEGRYLDALHRIKRRLGGSRHSTIATLLRQAFDPRSTTSHEAWIEALLTHYYDPMYDYQLARKQARVCFTGDYHAVHDYLNALA